MKFIKIINEQKEQVGVELITDVVINQGILCFNNYSNNFKKAKQSCYNAFKNWEKESSIQVKENKQKEQFKNFLKAYSKNKIFLTIKEIQHLLKDVSELKILYFYDLLGVGEVYPTKKGLKIIDSLDNVIYLYKNYNFYIDSIRINK